MATTSLWKVKSRVDHVVIMQLMKKKLKTKIMIHIEIIFMILEIQLTMQ